MKIKNNYISILLLEAAKQSKGEFVKNVQRIKNEISDRVFSDNPYMLTRILNNKSQPTLEQSAVIAQILDTSIESLFEFEEMQTANKV